MAQNITLLGASFADVPAVLLPKTGGGTALFSDPSITTAIASDVASGKTFLLADGSIGTGTASGGGGGASNVVTGTFTGTTTGAALEITLPYTGNGYPVAILIYPSEGAYDSTPGDFYSLVQRYAIGYYCTIKNRANEAPTYPSTGSGGENSASIFYRYKSGSSSATSRSSGQSDVSNIYVTTESTATSNNQVHVNSNKKLSVFIASTSYGFAANIEYKYWVLYSS